MAIRPATTQPCVFISYRKEDSAGWAGRLEDDLADGFGSDRVFRDIRIPAGVDYERHIERVLDGCRAVVVVIGPQWASLPGPDGRPRLSQPDDLLRREIERALQRSDVVVLPVLVQRARMPAAHELPPNLQPLARRQAIELSDSRWSHDIGQLITKLGECLEARAPVQSRTVKDTRRDTDDAGAGPNHQRLFAVAAMLLAGVAGVLVAWMFTAGLADRRVSSAPTLDRIVYYSAERAVLWGIIGAFVLAAAAATLRSQQSSAIGWGIVGLGFGVVAGALSGAAYMGLKDQGVIASEFLLRGIAAGIAGSLFAAALAKVVAGETSFYRIAGLAGGLLGGILAQQFLHDPNTTRSLSMALCEALVVVGAVAAVATTLPATVAARRHALTRT